MSRRRDAPHSTSSSAGSKVWAAMSWEVDTGYTNPNTGFRSTREICLFLENHEELARAGVTPQCGTMPPPDDRGDLIFVKPEEAERKRYLDESLATVEQAVKAGFRDRQRLEKDTALEPVRKREEFRKLLLRMKE